ncbi:MAG UNVERIFIED_CONTAM: methyltransferase [Planctomycetaceae bacterium]|jgi:putative N6-adenine-specific DNA methylase
MDLPWADLLPIDAKFPVAGRSVMSRLHAVPAVQGCVKKAIVESLKKKYQRFRFEESGAVYPIEISLLRDVASLTLDTSGDGLHKRGYRRLRRRRPLRETMAAGLIQLSYWNRERLLVDPFCGSGTIPIEAAMIGRNMAPGMGRSFAAEDWRWFDRRIWKDTRTEARDLRQPRLAQAILGFDHDPAAIRLSERGAREAGVESDVQFREQEVSDFRTGQEYGVVICNPPYGERLGAPKRSPPSIASSDASCPHWPPGASTSLPPAAPSNISLDAAHTVAENSSMASSNASSTNTPDHLRNVLIPPRPLLRMF